MSDLTIQICDFHTPSKSVHKVINKESMRKVLASEHFKKNLDSGRLLGLYTHKSRYTQDDQNIPFEDNVATSPYLANCTRKLWIDESKDALMCDIDLLNTKYGNILKDMYKKGIMMSYSMSVSATASDKEYFIDDWLGVDATFRPDLEAYVEKVNFSENPSERFSETESARPGKNLITFSCIPVEVNFTDVENAKDDTSTIDNVANVGTVGKNKAADYVVVNDNVKKEGKVINKSQEKVPTPTITKIEQPSEENTKEPVPNDTVTETPEVMNLDVGVQGEEIENITPKLFNDLGITESTDTNVSIENIHKDIPVEDQLSLQELNKMPNEMSYQVNETVQSNFSLQQYMNEMVMQPYALLFRRINEVIQLCRSKKQEWIEQNIDRLKSYFDSYVLTWIKAALNSDNEFNIGLGLRLNKFNVDQSLMRKLNITVKRLRTQLKSTGYMSKAIQNELNNNFQAIENALYKYIDDKIKPTGKSFIIEPKTDDKDGKK